jgi:hypothetical protein
MKIALNNKITRLGGDVTVPADFDPNYNPNNIINPSFSTRVTSLGSVQVVSIKYNFSKVTPISYVGIAGHNGGVIGGNMQIFVQGVLKISAGYEPLNGGLFSDFSTVLMATFEEVEATEIEMRFTKVFGSDRLTIVNMQAGDTIKFADPINNSEMGGYIRPWMASGVKVKSTVNREGQPTVSRTMQQTRRLTLSINNLQGLDDTAQQALYDWVTKMTQEQTWFMQERDGTVEGQDGQGSYLCSQGDVTITAGQNRSLNNMKVAFNAYIGNRS